MIAGRIRCSVGGEWHDRSHFSSAQLARLESAMRRDRAITVANSAIVCLEHSNRTALEIRCEGCRRILPVDRFSRNTRRKGKNVSLAYLPPASSRLHLSPSLNLTQPTYRLYLLCWLFSG